MLMAGICAAPRAALASQPKAVAWDDLIPPGVPYSEIIGVGAIDEVNDTWNPVFDENGSKLNPALDGAYIRMPGYILPLEFDARGVTDFILVPYLGACIHVPPPPPNQLVFVTARHPWPSESLWDAVWVTGHMRAEMRATDLADIGYALDAERIEAFEW
jgi:hypothetical protein